MGDPLSWIIEVKRVQDCCEVDLQLHLTEIDTSIDALVQTDFGETVSLLFGLRKSQVFLLGYEQSFHLVWSQRVNLLLNISPTNRMRVYKGISIVTYSIRTPVALILRLWM